MPALTFEVAPLQLAPAVIGAGLYWRRARTLSARGHPVEGWRMASNDRANVVALADETALKGMTGETILATQRRRFRLPWPRSLHGTPKQVEFTFDKQAF